MFQFQSYISWIHVGKCQFFAQKYDLQNSTSAQVCVCVCVPRELETPEMYINLSEVPHK